MKYFQCYVLPRFYNTKPTNPPDETDPNACAVELALAMIGGKWKLRIYDVLRKGESVRYCLINTKLKDISEKTLTAQLREMEQDGIITRMVYPEVPPHVEYRLTSLGQSLQTVFDALMNWGMACIEYKETGKTNNNKPQREI